MYKARTLLNLLTAEYNQNNYIIYTYVHSQGDERLQLKLVTEMPHPLGSVLPEKVWLEAMLGFLVREASSCEELRGADKRDVIGGAMPLEILNSMPYHYFDWNYFHALAAASRHMRASGQDIYQWAGRDIALNAPDFGVRAAVLRVYRYFQYARSVQIDMPQLALFLTVPPQARLFGFSDQTAVSHPTARRHAILPKVRHVLC